MSNIYKDIAHTTSLPTRFRPGAKAFIVHEGKILIVREKVRTNGNEIILHDVPGGGIEANENLHEGLHREVFEEVGLKVTIERPVGCWDYARNEETERVHVICTAFQCSIVGDPTIDVHHNPAEEDIFETVWLTKEEILSAPELLDNKDMLLSLENVRV